MSTTTFVDRIEASKILKVSTRTVDRYMRKYRLKTRKDGRRVLIKRVDIDKIIQDQIGHLVDLVNESAGKSETTNLTVKDVKVESIKAGSREPIENQIYKELYTEVKADLKEKQDRLEAATYRVGQLESEVKNMVPVLDFSNKERELKDVQDSIHQKERQAKEAVITMETKIRLERVAKYIYLSLVGLLLVVQPILFILWAFN